jgi:heterodisulfide reductase subunit A
MKKKIGVYVCECGPNIADNVHIDKILEAVSSFGETDDIEIVAKSYKLLCSGDGQEYLKNEIEENKLTHLIVAACSPRDHNSTFINVCKQTSLNPYLYKIINIREHCAWIVHDKEQATEKALQYIRGGLRRVLYQIELYEKKLEINPDVLVIGGGIAGIEAALSLASPQRKVFLIEKKEILGGYASLYQSLLPRQQGAQQEVQLKIQEVTNHPHIQVMTHTRLDQMIGFLGNFEVAVSQIGDPGTATEIKAGAIVVATGFRMADISQFPQFKISDDDEVYSTLDIEGMLSEKGQIVRRSGEAPKSVGLIFCVGRDERGYCSSICCNAMIKIAQQIKAQNASIKVSAFIRDLCLPDKMDQDFFKEVKAQGVEFIRVQEIKSDGLHIQYTGMDTHSGSADFDMLVLAPPLEPAEGTADLASDLGIPLHETGFYQEAHQTINPVATASDGVFIVGAAHGPKGITDSILQAQAAAAKIMSMLIPGEKIIPEVKVSEVLEAFCMGCKTCLDVCHYGAIVFDEEKSVSVVKEAICRGCGNCAGSCPSGAIQLKHFTNPQIYQEVIEALR